MKVTVCTRVCEAFIGTSSGDIKVYRHCEIPFAPFAGLSIVFPDGDEIIVANPSDDDWVYGGLSYDVDNKEFVITRHWHASRNAKSTVAERADELISHGWSKERYA